MIKREKSYPVFLVLTGIILFLVAFSFITSVAAGQSSSSKVYAYISNYGEDSVSVINTDTHMVKILGIPIGNKPYGVVVISDGTKVYVANSGDDTVSVIDTSTNEVANKGISVGDDPHGIAATQDGKKVYVTNYGSSTVSVIDTNSNSVRSIYVGSNPFGIAVAGTKAYVTNDKDNTISVIDTNTDNVIHNVSIAYESPGGIAVTPDGKKVYVTCGKSNNVAVIDTISDSVVPVDVGKHPWGIAISPDGKTAYVTNYEDNTVSIIDTVTNAVTLPPISVGAKPCGVVFTPDGKEAYVTNSADDSVAIIDTTTNSVTDTKKVESNPRGFGQFILPSHNYEFEDLISTTPINDVMSQITENSSQEEYSKPKESPISKISKFIYAPIYNEITQLDVGDGNVFGDIGNGNSINTNPKNSGNSDFDMNLSVGGDIFETLKTIPTWIYGIMGSCIVFLKFRGNRSIKRLKRKLKKR